MKATLPRVGLSEMLDRPSVAACHPADYFCLSHVATSGGANLNYTPISPYNPLYYQGQHFPIIVVNKVISLEGRGNRRA